MFAPPKMPGSTMGKSVLLFDSQAAATTSSGVKDDTILNMDLMQKHQMQKRIILKEEV